MRCVLQHCCTSINEEHWTGIAEQVSETLLFAQVSGPDVCRALSNMHVKHIVNSGVFFHFSKAEKQKSKWFSGTTTIEHFKQVVLNKAFVFFRPMINSIFRQFFYRTPLESKYGKMPKWVSNEDSAQSFCLGIITT